MEKIELLEDLPDETMIPEGVQKYVSYYDSDGFEGGGMIACLHDDGSCSIHSLDEFDGVNGWKEFHKSESFESLESMLSFLQKTNASPWFKYEYHILAEFLKDSD